MARIAFQSIESGDQDTLAKVRAIVRIPDFAPKRFQDIVNQLLVTCYLGTKHSSAETLDRAKRLAEGVGAQHFAVEIDEACDAITNIFSKATG